MKFVTLTWREMATAPRARIDAVTKPKPTASSRTLMSGLSVLQITWLTGEYFTVWGRRRDGAFPIRFEEIGLLASERRLDLLGRQRLKGLGGPVGLVLQDVEGAEHV